MMDEKFMFILFLCAVIFLSGMRAGYLLGLKKAQKEIDRWTRKARAALGGE